MFKLEKMRAIPYVIDAISFFLAGFFILKEIYPIKIQNQNGLLNSLDIFTFILGIILVISAFIALINYIKIIEWYKKIKPVFLYLVFVFGTVEICVNILQYQIMWIKITGIIFIFSVLAMEIKDSWKIVSKPIVLFYLFIIPLAGGIIRYWEGAQKIEFIIDFITSIIFLMITLLLYRHKVIKDSNH